MAARAESLRLPGVRLRPGAGLSVGLTTAYLSVIVLLPLAALAWESHGGDFWQAVTNHGSMTWTPVRVRSRASFHLDAEADRPAAGVT